MQCIVHPLKPGPTTFFARKEVEDFFDEMDRDFDGRLSFEVRYGKVHPCTRCNLVHFINFEKKRYWKKRVVLVNPILSNKT